MNSFPPIGASKPYLPEKNITELAAIRFKPNELTIQTPLVSLPSKQVQKLKQSIPEPIPEVPIFIPFHSGRRKSLKIKRPNKSQQSKILNQSKTLIWHNQPLAQEIQSQLRQLLKFFLVNPKTPQQPKSPNPKENKKNKKLKRLFLNKILKSETFFQNIGQVLAPTLVQDLFRIGLVLYTRLGPVQDIFNFYYDKMCWDLVDQALTKIIEKQNKKTI